MASPPYEGGSGGNIKRRLFRSPARTPYDRPPSAACGFRSTSTVKGKDGGWLPKLVEPASRFITRLFSSIFCKPLAALPDASGSEEKHLVMLDTPAVISTKQRVADGHNLITTRAIRISDIEQLLRQRRFTRAEVKHLMEMINSRYAEPHKSKSENNKLEKALKRDASFLDDESGMLGPMFKIPKKSIVKENKVVENFPFTTAILGGAIEVNCINDASTSSKSTRPIIRSTDTVILSHATLPSQRKSYFRMSAPEDLDFDEEVVENVPFTTAISRGAIAIDCRNDASTSRTSNMHIIRSTNTIISSHTALPSERKLCFHMSAPKDLVLDEEHVAADVSIQSSLGLGKLDSNFPKQRTCVSELPVIERHLLPSFKGNDGLSFISSSKTTMNDGSADTDGSNKEGDFAFPVVIDLNSYSPPPTPTMPNPSHAKLPFQKE